MEIYIGCINKYICALLCLSDIKFLTRSHRSVMSVKIKEKKQAHSVSKCMYCRLVGEIKKAPPLAHRHSPDAE